MDQYVAGCRHPGGSRAVVRVQFGEQVGAAVDVADGIDAGALGHAARRASCTLPGEESRDHRICRIGMRSGRATASRAPRITPCVTHTDLDPRGLAAACACAYANSVPSPTCYARLDRKRP